MSESTAMDAGAIARTAWHTKTAEDALAALKADETGLSSREVEQRRERFGPNTLPERERPSIAVVFLRQFRDPLIYILVLAAAISVLLGELSDGAFIAMVLFVNASIGTWQEWKAESGAAALETVLKDTADVRRDGSEQEVAREELVPGDIVLLESGDLVPADLRLLSASELRVDESLLTGESEPVEKNADAVLETGTPLGDRVNLAFAGTSVVHGRAAGLACLTGANTQVGRIAKSLAETEQAPPLVIKLNKFTRGVAIAVGAAVGILAVAQLARGAEPVDIFFLSVALAVAAIPEALPVAITVALSVSSSRMARRHVIVRRLPAVEGLGACTLVATDKTGTLTEGKLTLRKLYLPEHGEVSITGEARSISGEIEREGGMDAGTETAVDRLAVSAALCNEARLDTGDGDVEIGGDPVDAAFLILAAKRGMKLEELRDEYPEVGKIAYESARKYAASFNRQDGTVAAHVKGALEVVLPMCGGANAREWQERHDELAGEGFRILAVASGRVSEEAAKAGDESALKNLDLIGLAALIDPVREEVPDAVRKCRSARVEIRMITGDHPATARAIARQIGIASNGAVVTGADLAAAEAGDSAMREKILAARVFARVEPSQKTEIVSVLQDAGHFVAVTGDGVNDAPALNAAHIGVAMGKGGTDVAKRAADLVLTDDNFASIVNGIEEGRVAYDNVRKVTWTLLSTGLAEILLFLYAFATGMPLPLFPVQLLWLNVVTNGIQNIALAFEKAEPGILDRAPRPPDEPIFNRRMIEETGLAGLWIGSAGFVVFYWLISYAGWTEFAARNALLLLIVFFENSHVLNCRSEWRSLFRIPVRTNPLLFGTVAGAQALHIGAMYTPWLKDVLRIEPISLEDWAWLLAAASTLIGVIELYKAFRRKYPGRAAVSA